MIVLGIDGAMGPFSAAIVHDRSAAVELEGNVALEQGLEAVARVLRETHVLPDRLDRIAVSVGPGGFTGLRIALVYAKSLALSWRKPLVGISTFDVLEYGHALHRCLAIAQGRAGVVSARYRDGDAERRASGLLDRVLDRILPENDGRPLCVAGAAAGALAALGERGWAVERLEAQASPPSVPVAMLGRTRTPAPSLHEVRADYGESPAAKVPNLR